jgi:hypothetical protein
MCVLYLHFTSNTLVLDYDFLAGPSSYILIIGKLDAIENLCRVTTVAVALR